MTQKRKGLTKITSVSVSDEFLKIIKDYNLSPTEVFRRGVAVTLCDQGVSRYNNPLNIERLKKSDEVLKTIDKYQESREKLLELRDAIKKMLELLDEGI